MLSHISATLPRSSSAPADGRLPARRRAGATGSPRRTATARLTRRARAALLTSAACAAGAACSALDSRTGLRHAHRPWRVSRWLRPWPRAAVVWSLYTAACPHCPECHGEGGWWTVCTDSGDPEPWQCPRCALPLAQITIPAWLDRALPHSPARRSPAFADHQPPF
ncbi:hypothetical protein [Nocardia asiatica]|uniref:hypothetical protein n=1 Tax=Nocardia asiatica TaxID=209252 RepID=UPI0002FB3E9A|nr:hypothetical protein [Nocardia asiatica]